jgi:TetR/AcrR family transcriptional regulator
MSVQAAQLMATAPSSGITGNPPPGRRRADQIQGGHHGLSRNEVESSQRGRIVGAMIRLVGVQPFHEVGVADLVTAAGVSRKTFYQQFHNKEEVFAEAYDQALGDLLDMMNDAAEASQGRRDRLAVRVTTLLTLLARDEAVGRVCFVEVSAAGPLALERRRRGTAALAAALLGFDPETDEIPITALAAAGGLSEVIHHEIVAGRSARLISLAPDMVETVLAPIWAEAGWQ